MNWRNRAATTCGTCILATAVVLSAPQDTGARASALRAAFARAHDPAIAWSPEQLELIDWAFAAQQWLLDAPGDSQAELARGVLLSCLASPRHRELLYPDMLTKSDRAACSYSGPRLQDWAAGAKGDLRAGAIVPPTLPILVSRCEGAERKAFESVAASGPGGPEAQLRLGYLMMRASPSKSGQPKLLSLAKASDDPRYRFLATLFLGAEAEAVGDLTAAAARYREALAVNPSWPSAHQALASILVREGMTDSARSLLEGALTRDPSDPWYGYDCRIMTPEVAASLRDRESKLR